MGERERPRRGAKQERQLSHVQELGLDVPLSRDSQGNFRVDLSGFEGGESTTVRKALERSFEVVEAQGESISVFDLVRKEMCRRGRRKLDRSET